MSKIDFNGKNHLIWQRDAVADASELIPDNSVDLIVTDPPYGIDGDKMDRHYNRKEGYVLSEYIEVPEAVYPKFTEKWINEAARILKPSGSLYIISGYSNLYHILAALRKTGLHERNHIIWKFNFGVYTRNKYISSHYHILYYVAGGRPTFNTFSRFGFDERDEANGSLNYQDREDVWNIKKEYKHGQMKNVNELPLELLVKIIQYSSNPGDVVCDFFLGGFNTARAAIGMKRKIIGFELSPRAYEYGMKMVEELEWGYLEKFQKSATESTTENRYKRWTADEKEQFYLKYRKMRAAGLKKGEAIERLGREFGRGKFSVARMIQLMGKN